LLADLSLHGDTPVERRLARWVLMTGHRIRADELTVTKDALGRMPGVHRPTISEAAEAPRGRGPITYRRGQIAITERVGLERVSCEH
jgi:hypothetical protein